MKSAREADDEPFLDPGNTQFDWNQESTFLRQKVILNQWNANAPGFVRNEVRNLNELRCESGLKSNVTRYPVGNKNPSPANSARAADN